jgi:hypothetical protein
MELGSDFQSKYNPNIERFENQDVQGEMQIATTSVSTAPDPTLFKTCEECLSSNFFWNGETCSGEKTEASVLKCADAPTLASTASKIPSTTPV